MLEIHDGEELPRAPAWAEQHPAQIRLGINNRNLRTAASTSDTGGPVAPTADPSKVVAESGLREPADLARMQQAGIRNGLIGEHLMRQPEPGESADLAFWFVISHPSSR